MADPPAVCGAAATETGSHSTIFKPDQARTQPQQQQQQQQEGPGPSLLGRLLATVMSGLRASSFHFNHKFLKAPSATGSLVQPQPGWPITAAPADTASARDSPLPCPAVGQDQASPHSSHAGARLSGQPNPNTSRATASKKPAGPPSSRTVMVQCPLRNASICSASVRPGPGFLLVVYNLLARPRREWLQVPVGPPGSVDVSWKVSDASGRPVPAVLLEVSSATARLQLALAVAGRLPAGDVAAQGQFELVFQAEMPPLGYTTYGIFTEPVHTSGSSEPRAPEEPAVVQAEVLDCLLIGLPQDSQRQQRQPQPQPQQGQQPQQLFKARVLSASSSSSSSRGDIKIGGQHCVTVQSPEPDATHFLRCGTGPVVLELVGPDDAAPSCATPADASCAGTKGSAAARSSASAGLIASASPTACEPTADIAATSTISAARTSLVGTSGTNGLARTAARAPGGGSSATELSAPGAWMNGASPGRTSAGGSVNGARPGMASAGVRGLAAADGSWRINLGLSILYYRSSDGLEPERTGQASGAYIFRPPTSSPTALPLPKPTTTIVRSSLLTELRQDWGALASVTTRLYKASPQHPVKSRQARCGPDPATQGADFLELQWTVGPLPIDDGLGKELVLQLQTDLDTGGRMWSDSNGREMLLRRRDYRPSWPLQTNEPVAGNYYPMTSGAEISDGRITLAVATERAQGVASLEDGQLEIMLHRRTLVDDARGVGEPLNETMCGCTNCDCAGLIARGTLRLTVGPASGARGSATAGKAREAQLLLNDPPLLAFIPVEDAMRRSAAMPWGMARAVPVVAGHAGRREARGAAEPPAADAGSEGTGEGATAQQSSSPRSGHAAHLPLAAQQPHVGGDSGGQGRDMTRHSRRRAADQPEEGAALAHSAEVGGLPAARTAQGAHGAAPPAQQLVMGALRSFRRLQYSALTHPAAAPSAASAAGSGAQAAAMAAASEPAASAAVGAPFAADLPGGTDLAAAALPANVHLMTLMQLGPGQLLVRLAHMYQVGEHPVLSSPAVVDLSSLLPGRIGAVRELSLSAGQYKDQMQRQGRTSYRLRSSKHKHPECRMGGTSGSDEETSTLWWHAGDAFPVIELLSMEIRTFEITVA